MSDKKKPHNCSPCEGGFNTDQEYVAHVCTTGFTPKDIAHQDALTGGAYSLVSAAALARGEAKK